MEPGKTPGGANTLGITIRLIETLGAAVGAIQKKHLLDQGEELTAAWGAALTYLLYPVSQDPACPAAGNAQVGKNASVDRNPKRRLPAPPETV